MGEPDYLQLKSMAGAMGMSVNEYFNYLAKETAKAKSLGKKSIVRPSQKKSLYEAMVAISKMPNKPMGWSKEDEAIYSV